MFRRPCGVIFSRQARCHSSTLVVGFWVNHPIARFHFFVHSFSLVYVNAHHLYCPSLFCILTLHILPVPGYMELIQPRVTLGGDGKRSERFVHLTYLYCKLPVHRKQAMQLLYAWLTSHAIWNGNTYSSWHTPHSSGTSHSRHVSGLEYFSD